MLAHAAPFVALSIVKNQLRDLKKQYAREDNLRRYQQLFRSGPALSPVASQVIDPSLVAEYDASCPNYYGDSEDEPEQMSWCDWAGGAY